MSTCVYSAGQVTRGRLSRACSRVLLRKITSGSPPYLTVLQQAFDLHGPLPAKYSTVVTVGKPRALQCNIKIDLKCDVALKFNLIMV